MKCKEIIEILEKRYPPRYALEWDNVGLLIGDEEKEVGSVLFALDLTYETLEEARLRGAEMIITHHPLLFRPVGRIVRQDFIGRRIMGVIESGISYYAMHTNFDVAGMADRNALDLGLIDPAVLESVTEDEEGRPQGFGRVGTLAEEVSLEAFAAQVKEVFRLGHIRVYGDLAKTVRKAAVSSGSGKSSLEDALRSGADVFVTGDVDYHTAIDANMKGIAVIDAGHYGTEFCFIDAAAAYLEEEVPELRIFRAAVRQPYAIV